MYLHIFWDIVFYFVNFCKGNKLLILKDKHDIYDDIWYEIGKITDEDDIDIIRKKIIYKKTDNRIKMITESNSINFIDGSFYYGIKNGSAIFPEYAIKDEQYKNEFNGTINKYNSNKFIINNNSLFGLPLWIIHQNIYKIGDRSFKIIIITDPIRKNCWILSNDAHTIINKLNTDIIESIKNMLIKYKFDISNFLFFLRIEN